MANEAYHSGEYYKQQRNMLINGDPRALICFCIDVSKSMNEWWIEPGGLIRQTGQGFSDGHKVGHFEFSDIRPGYKYYQKIQKLNEVISGLITEFKRDYELNDKVAISLVVYSRFGRVLYDFVDSKSISVNDCICKIEEDKTAMGDGLRTALAQIDEMENDLRNVGKDTYTPLLVFMTDGTPTDDPSREFDEVRRRVSEGELHIFPLGIGAGADMARLRNMFPMGRIPDRFSERYQMVEPEDYFEMFAEIKSHVREKQSYIVSEGDSIQSAPLIQSESVNNNQMGEYLLSDLLKLM